MGVQETERDMHRGETGCGLRRGSVSDQAAEAKRMNYSSDKGPSIDPVLDTGMVQGAVGVG